MLFRSEVIWGVDTPATLEAIGTEMARDREVRRDADGTLHIVDDGGLPVGFAVTRRKELSLEPPPINTVGTYGRLNRQASAASKRDVGPYRIGHIVFWMPHDLVKTVDFYVKRLGFRLTDDGPSMRFMRCKGSSDHHSLLFQREGDFHGFQHVAYEYGDHDDVMTVGARMEAQGWRTNTGPLRHNISSSFSWYLWNPAGGATEAYTDMDCVTDDWKPHYHDPKDPKFYGRKVMHEFVRAGAPAEILYVSKPHIGTFRLVSMIEKMRADIEALGGEIRFQQHVTDIHIDEGRVRGVVLADGTQIEADHVDEPVAFWQRMAPLLRDDAFALCALDQAAHDLWGRRLGRPASLTGEQRAEVARQLGEGASVSALARAFKTSRQTILRIRDATVPS